MNRITTITKKSLIAITVGVVALVFFIGFLSFFDTAGSHVGLTSIATEKLHAFGGGVGGGGGTSDPGNDSGPGDDNDPVIPTPQPKPEPPAPQPDPEPDGGIGGGVGGGGGCCDDEPDNSNDEPGPVTDGGIGGGVGGGGGCCDDEPEPDGGIGGGIGGGGGCCDDEPTPSREEEQIVSVPPQENDESEPQPEPQPEPEGPPTTPGPPVPPTPEPEPEPEPETPTEPEEPTEPETPTEPEEPEEPTEPEEPGGGGNGGGGSGGSGGGGGSSGGGGGGGSHHPPTTVLTKGSPSSGSNVSFVTLSQVPYTGFPGGPVGTALFWSMLILWSGVAAYFMSVKGIGPAVLISRLAGALKQPKTDNFEEQDEIKDYSVVEEFMPLYPVQDPEPSSFADSYRAYEDSKGEVNVGEEVHTGSLEAPSSNGALKEHLQERATDAGVLISDDGISYLLLQVNGDQQSAEEFFDDVIGRAREEYPREDGWLHLNRERLEVILTGENENTVANTVAPATPHNLPRETVATNEKVVPQAISTADTKIVSTFIEWICDGKGELVFGHLRTLKSRGGRTSQEFLTRVLSVLDEVHRQRLEGGGGVDARLLQKMRSLSDTDIEHLMELLAGGIDYSYSESHTGVKMALMRALEYIRTRKV